MHRAGDQIQIILGALADQAFQQAEHEGGQARTVPVEEEGEDDAQGQFQNPAADLRTACQNPVTDLPQVWFERRHERRALLIDGGPQRYQPFANQRNTCQPLRWIRQAVDLNVLDQAGCVTHMVGEIEAQPHQRRRYQQHPAQAHHQRSQRFTALEPAGQQTHQRPAGKGQHRAPDQRRPERRHHPETGTEQRQQQNLHQQTVIVEHALSTKKDRRERA